jgi:hypothetical protein
MFFLSQDELTFTAFPAWIRLGASFTRANHVPDATRRALSSRSKYAMLNLCNFANCKFGQQYVDHWRTSTRNAPAIINRITIRINF